MGSTLKKDLHFVLYHDNQDEEVLLARITSTRYTSTMDIELPNWKQNGLLLKSWLRLHKLAAIRQDLLYKKLGRLTKADKRKVVSKLKNLIANMH